MFLEQTGGGVAAAFKDSFQCRQLTRGDFESFEYLYVLLKDVPKVLLLIVFRPPGFSGSFSSNFSELLAVITTGFDHVVIAGDFNIHIPQTELPVDTVVR